MKKKYNIVIIGAGMSGLFFAIAAQQDGHHVRVFEKAKVLTNIGGGILLYPNGVRVLSYLSLNDKVAKLDPQLERYRLVDERDNLLIEGSFEGFASVTGGRILPIIRNEMQTILVNELDEGTIHFNKAFSSLRHERNEVVASFEDGSEERADILIGADGIRSKVREQLFGRTSLAYQDMCFWGGILQQDQHIDVPPHTLHFFFGSGIFGIIFPSQAGTQCWYGVSRIGETTLPKPSDKISLRRDQGYSWHPLMSQAISYPSTRNNFEEKVFHLQELEQWHLDRSVLIGDAAHTIGPTSGLGTSAAFEDALILARCLDAKKHWSDAFKCYELIRRPANKVFKSFEIETARVKVSANRDVILERAKKYKNATIKELFNPLYPAIAKEVVDRNIDLASHRG
ncbi:FAD-dependent monooxygenase [Patescibacteria group bacterium]|nr:FAD-dependent monooxygenase [Patescibacteria group bacterium]